MDVRLLEAFRSVIDHRSVTRAAAALGISQPAVSTQIARLEEELGFRLFDRARGRLTPTAEARLFYAEVTSALSGLDRVAQAAEHIRSGNVGRLVVASHPWAAIYLLPGIATAFLHDRPETTVRILTRSSDVLRHLTRADSFDIGIAEAPIDANGLRLTRYRLRCVAVLPKDHPLAAHEAITPTLLSGVPFVAFFREHMTFHSLAKAFADAGARWQVNAEVEFTATAIAMAAEGAGVTVIDPLSAETAAALGLAVRPFEPAVHYEVGVFSVADRELSVLATAFHQRLTRRLGHVARQI